MRLIDDDLLGKLIDWHNETDTVVRVDIYDPFIIEILQDRKLRELIEKEIKDKDWRFDISRNRMLKLLEDSKK